MAGHRLRSTLRLHTSRTAAEEGYFGWYGLGSSAQAMTVSS